MSQGHEQEKKRNCHLTQTWRGMVQGVSCTRKVILVFLNKHSREILDCTVINM